MGGRRSHRGGIGGGGGGGGGRGDNCIISSHLIMMTLYHFSNWSRKSP